MPECLYNNLLDNNRKDYRMNDYVKYFEVTETPKRRQRKDSFLVPYSELPHEARNILVLRHIILFGYEINNQVDQIALEIKGGLRC